MINTATFRKKSTQQTTTVEVDSPAYKTFTAEIAASKPKISDVELISSQRSSESEICSCSKCRKA